MLDKFDPTVGHPARQVLLDWAEAERVDLPFRWFLHLTRVRTRLHWDFIATALNGLAACEPYLQRWHRHGAYVQDLIALASAWSQTPSQHPARKYTRPTGHSPMDDFRGTGAVDSDYLYLLLQCRRPKPGDEEPQLALRTWLFLKGMEFARRGNVSDRLLRRTCSSLRQACYEKDREWASFFTPIARFTNSLYQLEGRLRDGALEQAIAALSGSSATKGKHALTLKALNSLATGEEDPDGLVVSATHHFSEFAWPAPEPMGMQIRPPPMLASSDEADEEDDECPRAILTGEEDDEPDVGITSIGQDPVASPAEQEDATRTIHLLQGADARFLLWDWNRPSPSERRHLEALIERTLAEHVCSVDAPLAAFTRLALDTGLSLPEVLRIPLAPRANDSSIWSINLDEWLLQQRAPRREGHWRPSAEALAVIRRPLQELTWSLPTNVAKVLGQARQTKPSAATVGELWPIEAGSCLGAFNRWARAGAGTTRLTYGSLAMGLGVQIYRASGDPVLARLASARSFSGLPAASAYVAYTASMLAEHHPLSSTVEDSDANAAGSLLDTDGANLRDAFRRLSSHLDQAAQGDDFIAWHNLLALYWDARLRAATGVRPKAEFWTTTGEFDWERGFCFVDDKRSPHNSSGRLIPLPMDLLNEFRNSYVDDHLPAVSSLLASTPANAGSTPLLFLLQSRDEKLVASPITHAHRAELGLEHPLPTNQLRHRLRTWLHRHSADPEVIDSIFEHHDGATLTHGAYSMRCWLRDADDIRPLLARALGELEIASPPTWQGPRPHPANFDVVVTDESPVQSIGDERPIRKNSVQAKWRAVAMQIIRAYLGEKLSPKGSVAPGLYALLDQLAQLSEREMDELAQRLCRTDKGLPALAGVTRYGLLQRLSAHAWRHGRQTLNLTRRYLLQSQESSPFNAVAPKAGQLMSRLVVALDDAFRAEPHLSKLSARSATILAVADVMISTGATHSDFLEALISSPADLRMVQLTDIPYLEWAPKTSLVERPDAAVQRFRISRRAAVLLARIAGAQRRPEKLDSSSLHFYASTCDILGLPRTSPFDAWCAAVCNVVRQNNAITLPGTVAAFLDGRVITASVDQADWVRLQTGRNVAASWQQLEAHEAPSSLYEGAFLHDASPHELIEPNARSDSRRQAADEFLKLTRRLANGIDCLGTQQRRDLKVDELEAKLESFSRNHGNRLSGAVRMLGLWFVQVLRKKRSNGYAKVLAHTAVRYLDAVVPQFRELAYDVDLVELESDELTDFYRKVLQTSSAKDKNYQFERLRDFHAFARSAFAVDECDWNSIVPSESSMLGAPGLIDDAAYHAALTLSAAAPAPRGMNSNQCTVALILARRFGLRGKEIFGLRLSDLLGWPHGPVIAVRRRIGKRLKTLAARRLVPLVFPLETHERQAIEQLLAHHAGASVGLEDPPLLGDIDDPTKPLDIRLIRPHLNGLLQDATGRKGLTVHDLRHSFANGVWAAVEGFEHLPSWFGSRLAVDLAGARATLLGRVIDVPSRRGAHCVARLLGHAGVSTSLRSYIHLLPEMASQLRYVAPSMEPRWASQNPDSAQRLEDLPLAQLAPQYAARPLATLTPSLALEAMKLLPLRGLRGTEAALNLSDGTLERLADLVAAVEARINRLVNLEDSSAFDVAAVQTPNDENVPKKKRGPQARAASQGLLAAIRKSAYPRLRTGLQANRIELIAAAQLVANLSVEQCAAMIGPAGEISLWTPSQAKLVTVLMRLAVSASARVSVRSLAMHRNWAEQTMAMFPWPTKVSATSQLPSVYFHSEGAVQQRRLVVLVDDAAEGFTYNRAELVAALVCVISCSDSSANA